VDILHMKYVLTLEMDLDILRMKYVLTLELSKSVFRFIVVTIVLYIL
jgi:hypothetical protein